MATRAAGPRVFANDKTSNAYELYRAANPPPAAVACQADPQTGHPPAPSDRGAAYVQMCHPALNRPARARRGQGRVTLNSVRRRTGRLPAEVGFAPVCSAVASRDSRAADRCVIRPPRPLRILHVRRSATGDGMPAGCDAGRLPSEPKVPAIRRSVYPCSAPTSRLVVGTRGCGNSRFPPASCGDSRAGCARDEMKQAVVCA